MFERLSLAAGSVHRRGGDFLIEDGGRSSLAEPPAGRGRSRVSSVIVELLKLDQPKRGNDDRRHNGISSSNSRARRGGPAEGSCRSGVAEADGIRHRKTGGPGATSAARRTTERNGYRERDLETRLGTLELKIPKRAKAAIHSLTGAAQDRRARACRRHTGSVIQGVSTRKVDDLVQAMGMSGISKSQVSKLCEDIDERLNCTSTASSKATAHLWLDATYLKVRENGRIVSVAAIIARR